MATVQTLIDADIFLLRTPGGTSKKITKVFCCDLLSIAMGKAPAESAWVTVTANKNTLAVASFTKVSCIILAEGVFLNEADVECAKKEGLTVFETELPVFDAALKIKELILAS